MEDKMKWSDLVKSQKATEKPEGEPDVVKSDALEGQPEEPEVEKKSRKKSRRVSDGD
jgi:hypothetical protein